MNKDIFATRNIVCLSGGSGTSNLLRGLSHYNDAISVLVSMADDGGSGGRLRKLYNILPPGDVVFCLSALLEKDDPLTAKLLTYRFPGNRYGEDNTIEGQKVGNFLMAAAIELTGSFEKATTYLQELFQVKGHVYPATVEQVSLHAKTKEGEIVYGEDNIDRGNYKGHRALDHVYLDPIAPKASKSAVDAIMKADVIIGGPADLYTNLLPVLLVPEIKEAMLASKARKIYVVNVANKPFETKDYSVYDFVKSITNHLAIFPFDTLIVNNNTSAPIPKEYHSYAYVALHDKKALQAYVPSIVIADVISNEFPIYHDPQKLASVIVETI